MIMKNAGIILTLIIVAAVIFILTFCYCALIIAKRSDKIAEERFENFAKERENRV